MEIPYSYKNEDYAYITLPPLKAFCHENGLNTGGTRNMLIQRIEDFASKNSKNENIVKDWLDSVLKIGIKTCIIDKINLGDYSDNMNIKRLIEERHVSCPKQHVCSQVGKKQLQLVDYKIEQDNGLVKNISFKFIIGLLKAKTVHDDKGVKINYPVFVDVDFETKFMISRAKSASLIYRIENDLAIIPGNNTSPEKILAEAREEVVTTLGLILDSKKNRVEETKKTIFGILKKFTNTPVPIQSLIDKNEKDIGSFIVTIFNNIGVHPDKELIEEAKEDMRIMIEKYSSITYPDKKIFISDRDAYPIQFVTLDNEFTRIQEASAIEEPLQRKRAFFDSKKVVFKDKKCDKLCLCYKMVPDRYYNEKNFVAKITIVDGAFCIKISKFVKEGDIQNVLSGIIQMYNVQE